MELFFAHPRHISSNDAEFDSFETQHMLRSMRKKMGDTIHFTDGSGHLFKGEIIATKPTLKAKYQFIREEKQHNPQLAVGIGFIRHTRMDFAIEKVTELGADRIFLVRSRFSNYYSSNPDRWEKIARQAIKQSLRLFLPQIHLIPDLSLFLKQVAEFTHKFLLDQNTDIKLNSLINGSDETRTGDMVCLIGPEGGFDPDELKLVKKSGFQPVSLGSHRLRTETAAVAALSIMLLNKN